MSEHAEAAERRVRAALDMWQGTFQDCDKMMAISTVSGQSVLLASDLRAVLGSLDDYRNAYRRRGGVVPEPSELGSIARRAVRAWQAARNRKDPS